MWLGRVPVLVLYSPATLEWSAVVAPCSIFPGGDVHRLYMDRIGITDCNGITGLREWYFFFVCVALARVWTDAGFGLGIESALVCLL